MTHHIIKANMRVMKNSTMEIFELYEHCSKFADTGGRYSELLFKIILIFLKMKNRNYPNPEIYSNFSLSCFLGPY